MLSEQKPKLNLGLQMISSQCVGAEQSDSQVKKSRSTLKGKGLRNVKPGTYRSGRLNEFLDTLSAAERAIYWRGYHVGYGRGSKRNTVLKLETELVCLRQQIATLQK